MANEPLGLVAFIASKLGLAKDVAPAEAEQSLAEVLDAKDAKIVELEAKVSSQTSSDSEAKIIELNANIEQLNNEKTQLEGKVVELTSELTKVKADLEDSMNQSIELEKAKIEAEKIAAQAILKANKSPEPSQGAQTGKDLEDAINKTAKIAIKYKVASSSK